MPDGTSCGSPGSSRGEQSWPSGKGVALRTLNVIGSNPTWFAFEA